MFSSALLCPRRQLSVRKWDALRCPDFPLELKYKRQTGLLLYVGKGTKNLTNVKIKRLMLCALGIEILKNIEKIYPK